MQFLKKLIALCITLTPAFIAASEKGPCACKDCRCTQEKHCGCFSQKDSNNFKHQSHRMETKQESSK